jgi:hypothetical protein
MMAAVRLYWVTRSIVPGADELLELFVGGAEI